MGEVLNVKAGAKAIHYAVLLSVPVIWGSYGPLLQRFILTTSIPIPFYNLFSFLTCSFFLYLMSKRTEILSYPPSPQYRESLLRGGVELGLWLFLGATSLAYGLKSTSASKAAIVLSMKSVNVSILECISAKKWPERVNIVTCFLAVYGVWLVSGSSEDGSSSSNIDTALEATSPGVETGSILVLAASGFYSIHIFRLGVLSKTLGNTPLTLAIVKGLVMAALTLFLLCAQGMFVPSLAEQYTAFMRSMGAGVMSVLYVAKGGADTSSPSSSQLETAEHRYLLFPLQVWVVSILILWNGGVSIGYSMWAQVFAQKCISASAASFVYASTPMWAIFWSWVFLTDGVGAMSWANLFGCILLLSAVLIQLLHSSRMEPKAIE